MINFNNAKELEYVLYAGEDGPKQAVEYQGDWYMLKFPSQNKHGTVTDPVSEYIGCKLFKLAGIEVQDVLLGTYKSKDKTRVVCACRDFTDHGKWWISNMLMISNAILTLHQDGRSQHELSYIMDIIDMNRFFDPEKFRQHFWDMFVVDALIANWDRNIYNFGLLTNSERSNNNTHESILCPVYDCGSSLDVSSPERNTSIFRENGKRIEYLEFIRSGRYEDCIAAVKRIIPNIDMDEAAEMVHAITCLSEEEKEARINFIRERYESMYKNIAML